MKTRVMKKKFRRMLCASMAAIFVMSDMMPVAFAQGTAAETLPAPTDTERIIGFEMVNPLNSYEIKAGESLESLDAPEKIRVIVELPEDTRLSTFEEGEAPEQTDDTLPAYEYSHTLEQLSMSSEEDTASSGEEAAPSGEDTASSEDSSGAATSEDPSSAQEPSYTEEEIAGIYQESLTKKLGTVNVYALTDNAGASQYRVYGSIEAQAPQWYAIDENGVMLGAVEELDANWDFTGFDSTVAGEHQVKAQLPENYILSEGVEMACLQIVVTQEEEEQSSIENEDGSLPDSLPVSYIQARAAQARAVAPFNVTIQREGIAQTIQAVFKGGTISADSKDMPSVQDYPQLKGYRLKETKGSNGKVKTNGASLMVTDASGATVAYSNVTAMYPLEQNGATVWYYTTTATSSSIAWKIPDNATLRFIYEPENPDDTTRFTKVTVTSNHWRDGSASGIFEDGKRDYVAVLPVGEEASITVDLPDLFSKISKAEYINFGNNKKPTYTTTKVQASQDFGPYKGNIDTTATFKFTVPEVANNPDGVTIRLTFSSYNNGNNSILWFRMSQPYLQKSHQYRAADGNWSGYRAFRLFSAPGTGQFTYNTQSSMYFQVGGGGSFQQVNQQGFQSYGPGIAPSAPSGYQHPNFNQDAAAGGTYDPVVKAQPGYHADDTGGTFNEVNKFWDTSTGALANSKSIPGDGNGDRTLFFTVENTLANLTPDFANNPNQVGQNLPVGFIVRTQRNPDGFFVPLETEADLGSGTKAGTVTNNEVLLTTSFSGMNIKVTRNWYNIKSYKTNAGFPANGNLRDWKYSIQIQGAVGFLGINFVFPNDIQNYTNLQDVSPNVGSAQIFTTTGGNSTTGRQWITVQSGAGKNFANYQFGATQYGKLGETEKTTSNGFFGTNANTNNWTINYVVTDAGNAGVPIRLERKEGYGIPYLVFPGYNNARAGISKLNVNAQGYSNIENFTIGATNRPVQGRMYRDRSGRVYFDYLFGHYRANGSWDGWGKNVVFRIQADPAYVAVDYSTSGVDLGSSPPAAFSKTAVYNDSATEYVAVPETIPQKTNSGTFIGWKIKKQGGGYVQQNGKDVFLQPGSVISVRDTQYFPKEQLPRANGVNFTDQDTQVGGTGYYNVTRITLEPAFANDTTTAGSLINGSITTETQNSSTSYNALKPDPVSVPENQYYYIPHEEEMPFGGILYLYNAAKSKASGQATTGTTSFGKLVYDKAFKVTYSNPTTDVPAGATPPGDNARYTMTDGNKNTINLQKPSGLTNAADFTGWKILYGNGQESAVIPSNVTQLVLNGAAQQDLQIDGTKATVGGTLAQSLFNEQAEASGTDKGVTPIRLQAVYSTLQRITLPDGTMTAPQEEVKMYQSPYTISATFNMASAVSAGSTADYAIYIYKDKQWGIADLGRIDLNTESITRATQNRLWGNIADADCTAVVTTTGNSTDITLTVSNIKNLAGNRNEYRIYMWNSKNGDANLWQDSSTIQAGYMKNLDAFRPVENYPYKSLLVRQIPKVFTEDSTQITESKKDKLFYEGQEFTVSGTFSLETGQSNADKKDTFDQIHTNNTNTEIKVALYKVDPPGTTGNYDIWSINSGPVTKHSGKVSAPTITRISDTKFTVSFTITDSSGSISNKWDDGAKYRVFAWTGSNERITANPDFGQEGDAFPVKDNITTIPSTITTMAGVLGQQVESIIHYPKQIAMMDNVKQGNNHIFSGDQKITMTPLKVQEGSQTVEAEVPDPDSGVDVVIQEIKDKQDADNSIKVSRTVGSGSETINLTCFLGTIESSNAKKISSNGKVGTLYFADGKNEIPLYFRSSGSTPPNVADGAPFTGQIHFIFSKSGSGN